MDYIVNDDKYTKKMLDIFKNANHKSIMKFIEWKHFHKNHPENWNIRTIPSAPTRLSYFTGKVWKDADAQEVLQRLFERVADDIDNFISHANSNAMELDLGKFKDRLAIPLQFDMMHIDTDVGPNNYTTRMENFRDKFYDQTLDHLKILSENINGQFVR